VFYGIGLVSCSLWLLLESIVGVVDSADSVVVGAICSGVLVFISVCCLLKAQVLVAVLLSVEFAGLHAGGEMHRKCLAVVGSARLWCCGVWFFAPGFLHL
jgi:hypothetical protein